MRLSSIFRTKKSFLRRPAILKRWSMLPFIASWSSRPLTWPTAFMVGILRWAIYFISWPVTWWPGTCWALTASFLAICGQSPDPLFAPRRDLFFQGWGRADFFDLDLPVLKMLECGIRGHANKTRPQHEGAIGQWPRHALRHHREFRHSPDTRQNIDRHEHDTEDRQLIDSLVLVDVDETNGGVHQEVDLVEQKGRVAVERFD